MRKTATEKEIKMDKKQMKPKRNAFFSTRKFKYGAAATVFTKSEAKRS